MFKSNINQGKPIFIHFPTANLFDRRFDCRFDRRLDRWFDRRFDQRFYHRFDRRFVSWLNFVFDFFVHFSSIYHFNFNMF